MASTPTGNNRPSTAGRPEPDIGEMSSYRWEAAQIADAPADTLKSVRIGVRLWPLNHRVPTRTSSTTMNVAMAGPNQRTAAKTNTSVIDRRALIVGILSVREPVSRVRAIKMAHPVDGGNSVMETAE